jgi:hypothetical protein
MLFFGRSAMALRLAAAVIGTLTTWMAYQVATTWFGWRVGLLSAWLWAITLWPLHLSRIGLRAVALAPLLALVFWLGALAYRRQQTWLWLLAGLAYGASFYTYLAARFTPLLLLSLAVYLAATGRLTRVWPGALWFGLGTAVALAPLAVLTWQQPTLILGRTGQVSILNPDINQGNLWSTLGEHLWRALGMFLWRGDTILRHNPAGRPVFDVFMALPFLVGLGWLLVHWRRPAAAALLLWTAVMLGPTILAEDTPHFLRAAGILPAIVIWPAIGLSQLWQWPRWPRTVRQPLVAVLALASLALTLRDYAAYSRQPDVAYLFEAAASDMARHINGEAGVNTVFVDERFWSGWPSIRFLAGTRPIALFRPEEGLPTQPQPPLAIYAWPYGPLDFVPEALGLAMIATGPLIVSAETGSLARGDLEETAYPLYVRYSAQSQADAWPVLANFGHQLRLQRASLTTLSGDHLQVDLYWSTETAVAQEVVAFVHVAGANGLVGQDDAPPAAGHWPISWWRPGFIVHERRVIALAEPYDPTQHQLYIGLYDPVTLTRLPVLDAAGEPIADAWLLHP